VLTAARKESFKKVLLATIIPLIGFIHEFLATQSTNLVKNYGISLGQSLPFLYLIVFIFIVSSSIIYFKENKLGVLLIVSGGLINFIDRIRFGFVRDYWELFDSSIYNNINDWIIATGVILFLIDIIWKKSK
jgi:lipoprotein signal peptidase